MHRVAALCAAAVLIAGCSEGTASRLPATAVPSKQTASVTFSIVVPAARAASSASRSPRYVSPGTSAVRVVVNDGAPQTFQVGSSQSSCWPPQTNEVCSVFTIDAPVGTDTFAVTLLDASALALSEATLTATIVSAQANVLRFVANGVVASLAIALSGSEPSPGTAANRRVDLPPLDADGYTIIGTLPPIAVTDSDPSGATALFLATDSTCATPATASMSSVSVVQANGAYPTVCLSYSGAAMSSPATLTATISGAPSATAYFQPATSRASGVWALGTFTPTSPSPELAKFDTNLDMVQTIAGSASGLTESAAGIDVDAAGNVDVLAPFSGTTFTIQTFSSSESGNVAPHAVTAFTVPAPQSNMTGPALDRHGGAYVMGITTYSGTTSLACTIYYVPLNGATATASAVRDCTSDSRVAYSLDGFALHTAPSGDLYAAFDNSKSGFLIGGPSGYLYRYAIAGTGLTAAGNAYVSDIDTFAFFADGDVLKWGSLAGGTQSHAVTTTAQSFTATFEKDYPIAGPLAVDESGNAYGGGTTSNGYGLVLVPSGSTTVTKTSNFYPWDLAAYVGP